MGVMTRWRVWPTSVTSKVFLAHSIATWGDRMWNFAISLFLVKMSGTYSLRLTAVYGLICCASSIVLGTAIGRWIDSVPRITAAVKALVVQNCSVLTCAVILSFVIYCHPDDSSEQPVSWPILAARVLAIFFGALAHLASMASSISISKDWVVVIAEKDKERLATINAMCRTIDLTTKICSPFLVGCIMSQMSYLVAAMFIAAWNIVSMFGEYLLLRSIYNSVPALAHKNVKHDEGENQAAEEQGGNDNHRPLINSGEFVGHRPIIRQWSFLMKRIFSNYLLSWKAYFRHNVFMAGLGLACLYMTVLAFDGITVGYAYSRGISETVLGVLGGVGALVGILGTYVYPRLRRRIGLECAGFVGFVMEVSCLVLCVVAVWAPGSPFDSRCVFDPSIPSCLTLSTNTGTEAAVDASIVLLMTGITLARFGLWVVDLSVSQIIQEEVNENERGSINGSQFSLNMAMNLVKFGLVILLPYPKTFGALVLISFAVICSGWFCYSLYCRKKDVRTFSALNYFCYWQLCDTNSSIMSPIGGGKVV